MPRYSSVKCLELAFFWREHLKVWRDSNLNQREYCERHGLALKRFGNWRAKFKDKETFVPPNLLYRRGGGLGPRSRTRSKEIPFAPMRKRRGFSDSHHYHGHYYGGLAAAIGAGVVINAATFERSVQKPLLQLQER